MRPSDSDVFFWVTVNGTGWSLWRILPVLYEVIRVSAGAFVLAEEAATVFYSCSCDVLVFGEAEKNSASMFVTLTLTGKDLANGPEAAMAT